MVQVPNLSSLQVLEIIEKYTAYMWERLPRCIVMYCLSFRCDIFWVGRAWPFFSFATYHPRQDESLHLAEKTQMAEELKQ